MTRIEWAYWAPHAIDTLVFTFRILAAALSLIGLANWWSNRKRQEHPPHDRRRNEIAWAWAYAGMAIGGCSFVALDMNYRNVTGQAVSDLFVAAVWWCWANAVTVRMSARVERPYFVYAAATVFIVGGSLYSLMTGG